jgi:DNA-binding NtrC family response regulator
MDGPSRPATQILTRADGTTVQLVRQASLKVVKGPDKGRAVTLSGGVVRCGADESCELVLRDSAVSSFHFEVRTTPSGFSIRDLESTNGTFVEGLRVGSCLVDSPAVIRVGKSRLKLTPQRGEVEIPLSVRDRFGSLLGASLAMRRVYAVLERVARVDATLLIEGESGTGKELVACSVHEASERSGGPMVVVNCGAIPENLIESQLFGHERGAFTGAERTHIGYFEAAQGGTIFLDEIGELPRAVQPRLLRVLQLHEITRVGSSRTLPVDVRVLAATNRNLAREVGEGRFREDLFYRLAVVRVEMPPLRERLDDIPLLVEHFLQQLAPEAELERALTREMMALLRHHDWPGNVRELKNVVERLLVFPELGAEAIRGSRAPSSAGSNSLEPLFALPFHEARTQWTERFERAYLEAKLEESEGVVLRAAERAEIPRQTFHRLMRKHGL